MKDEMPWPITKVDHTLLGEVHIQECIMCCQDAIVYQNRWSIHLDANPYRHLCPMSGELYNPGVRHMTVYLTPRE